MSLLWKGVEGLWDKTSLFRALEEIARLGKQWKDDGSKQATRKKYVNCVGVPIVGPTSLETETYVIDVFGIPTLHCVL